MNAASAISTKTWVAPSSAEKDSSPSVNDGKMQAEMRASEPSMEEILASIRRIIADDSGIPLKADLNPSASVHTVATASAALASVVSNPAENDLAEILAPIVADRVIAQDFPVSGIFSIESGKPLAHDSLNIATPAAANVLPAAPESHLKPAARMSERHLVDTLASDGSASRPPLPGSAPVSGLSIDQDDPLISPATDSAVASSFQSLAAFNNAERFEQVAASLLRPMLKTWLDDNLPVLVERLVRAEIERAARGLR